MSDKPALPAPGRISIRILNLSTEVQSTLREVGIRTVGHLFRPTEAQQAHLRERLVPASARELLGKTRSFYRTYRKVQKLLAEAESVQTDTPVGEQALKERPQPAEMPVEDEESPLPGASAAEEEMVAEMTGERIEQPASNHGAAAEAALAEVPIAELSVPGPVLARLEQRGIETALDLAERSDAELAEIRYVGAAVIPGFGLLVDDFTEPYLHHWRLESESCFFDAGSGIRLPYEPFCGVMGVAPAEEGRFDTLPPRYNGGNIDIRGLGLGSTLWLPVWAPGALFSTADCHAAQGDGEVSGTGIETPMTVTLRFDLVKDANLPELRFQTPSPLCWLLITSTENPDNPNGLLGMNLPSIMCGRVK